MEIPRQAVTSGEYAKCYLCGERRPKAETEITRHRVSSALMGGLIQGVNRYVRMCRVGFGCKGGPT